MTYELTNYEPKDFDDLQRYARMLSISGYFSSKGNSETAIAQTCVAIMAGNELGFNPIASVRGIQIINGQIEIAANLLASAVKAHPKYDYRVKNLNNEGCTITFYESGELLGESTFTNEDAAQAELGNSKTRKKFPRNMHFARAMSNGVKWYCPDVTHGHPVYVQGEVSGDNSVYGSGESDCNVVDTPNVKSQSESKKLKNHGRKIIEGIAAGVQDANARTAEKVDHTQTHIDAVNQQYGTNIEEVAKDLSWINGDKAREMDAKADGIRRRADQEPDSLGPYGDGSEMPGDSKNYDASDATWADANKKEREMKETVKEARTITGDQRKRMHAIGGQVYGDKDTWDSERHRLVGKLTNGRTNNSTELTVKEAGEFIDWLDNQFNRKMDKQRQSAETIAPPTSEVKSEQQIDIESQWNTSAEIPF